MKIPALPDKPMNRSKTIALMKKSVVKTNIYTIPFCHCLSLIRSLSFNGFMYFLCRSFFDCTTDDKL